MFLLTVLTTIVAETTDDTTELSLNEGSLVFTVMGLGTFLIAFLGIATLIVFALSTRCAPFDRFEARKWTLIVFVVVALILFFAQRQSKFKTGGYEKRVYDESIVPRILLVIIMGISAYFAVTKFLFNILTVNTYELTTIDNEASALWQN
jgi:hypothetical protein